MNKIVKRIIISMMILLVVVLITLLGVNFFVVAKTKSKILTE